MSHKWSAYVVKVLRQHPRAQDLGATEVAHLAEPVQEALVEAYRYISEGSRRIDNEEVKHLWPTIVSEAARMHAEKEAP